MKHKAKRRAESGEWNGGMESNFSYLLNKLAEPLIELLEL